tara:strand:- start:995 stop:1390 length:396 start_codon:yes stop_codon:yes gene_type:complete
MDEIYCENFYDDTNVIELINKDFNKKKKGFSNKKYIGINGIIVFYSNLCSHCKNSYNTLINISDIYKNKFNIYTVNCNNLDHRNDYLIRDFKISQYPQYKLINNNIISDLKFENNNIENFVFVIENNLKIR